MEVFGFIRERVWAKLRAWRGIWFSQAGRGVLIKSVLQAIPSYAASCFRLPKTLISAIHKVVAKFWWGNSGDERKTHWCKWEELTKHKSEWGLGFRDLEKFNQALVAKSVWRLIRRPGSLIERVLQESYYPSGDILGAACPSYGSNLWRGLVWGKEVIIKGSRWRVGDGESVFVATDKWIPRNRDFGLVDPPLIPEDMRVADLKSHDGEWNEALVRVMFGKEDADAILAIPSSRVGVTDVL